MKQTASLDKIISSVGYAFEMYISEFSGMSDFNEEEVEQERQEVIDFIKSQQAEIERLKAEVEKAYVSGQNNILEAQAEGR